jgi:hypothetical protein
MKHALLLSIVTIASLLLPGRAAQARALPIDTVAGQAHFTHMLSAGMCTRLAQESQKADLTQLTGPESEALLKRLMLGAMGDNFTEFSTLMEKAGQGETARLGQAIGAQAVVEMVQRCPSAGALMAKIGGNHLKGNYELSATERSVLLPITQAACQRLDAENAKQPFAKLTPAQRGALVQQALGAALLTNSQALIEQYGDEVMESGEQGEEIGKKVGLLMLEVCPNYILEVGRDEMARKQQAATPAPKTKTPPARKAPAKPSPIKSGSKR